jgi:predicted branched-subunit amino acid permease
MATPSWLPRLAALVAIALVPWTLWLTFSLPSKHVSHHYDVAWVGFDVALAAVFAATAFAAYRRSAALVGLAAATAAMLICDAWFDVVTSAPGERLEAVLQAGLAELPLAALCAYVALRRGR